MLLSVLMLRRERSEEGTTERERGIEEEEIELIGHPDTNRPRRRRSAATVAKQPTDQPQYGKIESQLYEQEESEVWWHHQLQR
ncbi:hypothetical protein EON63_18455 [archaeon]|nr:MAG: hypothetical protein EON63_18455 [archaeon]